MITRYRHTNQNLQTKLRRTLRKAGVTPWPKLYQNLRSTRQTELADRFPVHVVCAWLGNSAPVAMKHYLQVTDEHFRQAAQEAVQKAVQPPSAATCQNPPAEPGPKEEPAFVASGQRVADSGKNISKDMVGDTGLEQPSKGQQKRKSLPEAAQNAAHLSAPADVADVADLAARLAALPENVRRALAAALAAK
ncbi:MAG: hypothetical protein NTY65_03615 [Planctomycetota bacterium]|nr:hypothetical protein [Planctomycetota bacterium]